MRNKNVDIIRALALSIVIIYHIWIIFSSREKIIDVINAFYLEVRTRSSMFSY